MLPRTPAGPGRDVTLPAGAEDRLARNVLGPCLGVRPREVVAIETWNHALPWALALVREARRRHARPFLVLEEEETFFGCLRDSAGRSVPQVPPRIVAACDAYVYLPGPEAFPRLFGLRARDLRASVEPHGAEWWREVRRHGVRVARLAIASAGPTAAGRYGVDVGAWQREVLRASLVPPGILRRRAVPLARRLARARTVRIRHENGTDLSVGLRRGGPVILEDGQVDRIDRRTGHLGTQVPSGVVAVELEPGSVEGLWVANRQTHLRFENPPVAAGVRFTFRTGRLRESSLERGGAAFAAAYAAGGTGRARATRLAFGVNPAVRFAPELEEIAAGTVTLWVGEDRPIDPGHPALPFSFVSPLAEADVDLDGLPWWSGGRLLRSPSSARRTVTRPRRQAAGRSVGATGPRRRDGGERSAPR